VLCTLAANSSEGIIIEIINSNDCIPLVFRATVWVRR
jgi:hypothetical protein